MVEPLKIENLTKHYGSLCAVNDLSFTVKKGEIFGLLGPNGAGKTSTISIITTLEEATKGRVSVFGYDVATQPKMAKVMLGVVPQELINHGFFTVEELLAIHSGYYGLLRNQERIEYLLKKLDLQVHRHKKVKELSGGLKRRLLIAKALVHSPKLLLLDEPTAGVDVALRASLWEFIKELKASGVSILLTTHYLEEAESLCDRIGIVNHGVLKKIGQTQDLVKDFSLRRVVFTLKEPLPKIHHSQLLRQTNISLTFELLASENLGRLIADLQLDIKNIQDIRIREGTLEDAFQRIVDHG